MKLIRPLTLLLLAAAMAVAQSPGSPSPATGAPSPSLTITSTVSTARPGQAIPLSLNLIDTAPSSAVAGLQWELSPGPLTWVAGAAATTAVKTIYCGTAAPTPCIVIGNTAATFASGVVATGSYTIPAGTAAGPYTFSLPINSPPAFGVLAANVSGSGITFAQSPALVIAVLSRFDVNSDGTVTNADVSAWIAQVLTSGVCTPALDFNGDGLCNIDDVVQLVAAINGSIAQ